MRSQLILQPLWMLRSLTIAFTIQVLALGLLGATDRATQSIQSVKEVHLTLRLQNRKIVDVFKKIETLSDFTFEYNTADLRRINQVSGTYTDQTLYQILVDVSRQTGMKFKQVGNNIAVARKRKNIEAQEEVEIIPQVSVTGKVIDPNNNEGLPGVNVLEKGTTNGTVTDIDGNYSISVADDASLIFSSIGYTTQEVSVDGRSTINISLSEDVQALDEIVVIGYGTQEKKDVTGSIATVDQKDFAAQPVTRFDQILQGRTPGVNVTNSSGAPGGAVSIRIRGANSINGSNEPLYVVDGFVGADFRDVNPSDIESIQVLKDASATAIYGSRGANGVVLITTKTGKAGEPKLSLTARYFSSEVLDTWDLLDAGTFAEVANRRANVLGSNPPFSAEEVEQFRRNGGTDWQDEIFRTGLGQEYQVDYSGGNEAVTYFISGNFLDQEGTIINSDFKRYSLRTNIRANLSEKLTANLKMNFTRRENNNTEGGYNTSGPVAGALAWAPTTPARDENGIPTLIDPVSSIKVNPIELAENDNIVETNTINANGGFSYEIIDGLTADVSFGINYANGQRKAFSAARVNNNPSAARGSVEEIFLQNTNSLSYNKVFGDIHNLTITGVVEHQLRQSDQFSTNAVGLQFPELKFDNITLAGSATSQALRERQTIRSYIGRVNYTLMDRYLITASIRADGSSKFRGDNQFGYFPSMALGWRLSEEEFIKSLNFFDDLKLRGSYGVTGSQAIPVFGTITSFNTSDQQAGTSFENGQLTSGIIIGNPGNSNLKWETTEQINFGIDMQIFNGRLGFTADYFKKNTTDLLLSEPLPQYSGGGAIFRNLGEVENSGFEFGLTSTVVDNGKFNWYTSVNLSLLDNEVISIGDREQIFSDTDAGAGLTNLPEMVILPGQSLASYWGLNYLGVWGTDEAAAAAEFGNIPGDSKYEDINGDGVIGGDDYQIIGSAIPTRLFGWNNNFTYGNFTLNVFWQAMMGYDKWNFAYATAIMANADAREVTHTDIQNQWVADSNEGSDIPAFSSTDVSEIQSSRFMESGDFLRLKNVSLTYNLPANMLKGVNGSVMIGATNLLTFTNYRGIDPESFSNRGQGEARGADGGAYPNSKTWVLGINLTF